MQVFSCLYFFDFTDFTNNVSLDIGIFSSITILGATSC